MGCFTILKHKKKKSGNLSSRKPPNIKENATFTLPEPESHGPSLQSAPPSFRNRTKSGQSAGQYPNIRTRALSAPSSLVVAERDALASMEFDDQEEYRSRGPMVKDQHFSNPLPLPLPSPQANSVLKNLGSFKSSNTSGPIAPSGPLPLPPLGGGFRKFSYEEVSCACLHFSADRCISEGTSSTIYKASFSDDTMGLKKTDATVTRACSSLSLETLEKGLLTPKSNVWSFGIVLLELLTGRKNLDNRYPKEERNIVKWSRPFLDDDCRLSLIMDPRIKGRFPSKAARTVADIALKCLQKDPSERPTMRTIVESLENVQDMKYPSRYPLQEPSVVSGKQMLKSQSINGIIIPTPSPPTNFSPSPPQRLSSPRVSLSIPLPRRSCSTTVSLEDNRISSSSRKPPSPTQPRPTRVEGF
ncbi:hypothetical protein GW17_00011794 [Ensete ventricosum]|nr:hypothetical protein GW17_00011794 [Ensete ventricosum]